MQTAPFNSHIDLRVQSIIHDLDELKLPTHDDAMLRENLQEIIEINGTTDLAEKRYKRMLLTQTAMTVSLHKRQLQHTSECIVSRMVQRDEQGKVLRMPWEDAIDALREDMTKRVQDVSTEKAETEEEEPEEVKLGGKIFQLATFRGKYVTRIITVAISVLLVVGGVIVTIRMSKNQLASMMQVAITEAVRREAQQVSTPE